MPRSGTPADELSEGGIAMSLDAVLKIGGSLSRGEGLEALCREISNLGMHYHLLVVPGGGKFADQVRQACRRYRLDDTAGHRMAMLAMDQYGYLLHQLIAGSTLRTNPIFADSAVDSAGAVVLLPSSSVARANPLPHSWQVTSDTIAAWVAHQTNCRRLVLLKDVDGLLAVETEDNSPSEMIAELGVEQLGEHSGGVDEYLSRFLASAYLETWIINGLFPERLVELLNTGRTMGTHVIPPKIEYLS
jgi:aspartokinase-like uncharacterized kinase